MMALAIISLSSPFVFGENAVLYWNNQVLNTTRLSCNPPPIAALHFASFHTAIFDTINSFSRTSQGWLINDPAPVDASLDAAVASSTYTVISTLWRDSANPQTIRAAYDQALAPIPNGPAKDAGIAWGKKIAEAVMFERAKVALKPGDKDYPRKRSWISREGTQRTHRSMNS